MSHQNEKRPRQYAAEIIALNPDDRPAALEQIPAEHRAAVAQYLECWETKRNGQIEHYWKLIFNMKTRTERNAALVKVPEDIRPDVKQRVELAMLAAKMRLMP